MNAPATLTREEQTAGDRLIARANAAIAGLRHGAEVGTVDAAKALKLAARIQRELTWPADQPIINGRFPHLSNVAWTLHHWGPWIEGFVGYANKVRDALPRRSSQGGQV